MTYPELKQLATNKGLKISYIASELGITRQGLMFMLDNDTISVRHIKKLCVFLKINPLAFFDNPEEYARHETQFLIENKDREIELLKEQVVIQKEMIEILKINQRPREYGCGGGI